MVIGWLKPRKTPPIKLAPKYILRWSNDVGRARRSEREYVARSKEQGARSEGKMVGGGVYGVGGTGMEW